MRIITAEQLATILAKHRDWLIGKEVGDRANLSDANLSGADLSGADLSDADLSDANLSDETQLQYGDSFKDYKAKIVPALCEAGGKSLVEVAVAWDCHDWTNCPMATAFSVHREADCPPLLLPRVREFVQLFDARLIPCPVQVPAKGSESK